MTCCGRRVRLHHFIDVIGQDLKVDDAACLSAAAALPGRKLGDAAHCEVVEGG